MPSIRTGHITTNYQSIGKNSKTLLLLHGWGHTWETWSPLIPELAENYRLIIPDLPGFGATQSPHKGWGMYQYSFWLATFLRNLEIDELEGVVGHSFGGNLASFSWFAFAEELAMPSVQKGFFLISPSGLTNKLPASRKFLRSFLPYIPHIIKRKLLRPIRQFLYVTLLNETDYWHATPFQEASLHEFLSQNIRETVIDPRPWPLHLAWGQKDAAVPLWMAYTFRTISQQSDVFVLPNADHYTIHTHPDLLRRWLEAHL